MSDEEKKLKDLPGVGPATSEKLSKKDRKSVV